MAFSTAREFVAAQYGDELVSNILETDVTVGVAAIQIAKRDSAVIERIISNNGAQSIFIGTRSSVALNQGIPLASGSTLSITARDDFDLASCDLFAISAAAGNPVHVISMQLVGAQSP